MNSTQNIHLYRSDDQWVIDLTVHNEYKDYDYFTIQIHNGLFILSTTTGAIVDEQILIREKTSFVHIKLLHDNQVNQLDIVISYFINNDVVHNKTYSINIPSVPNIMKKDIHINTTNIQVKSKWKLAVELDNDVTILFISSQEQPTLMVFGEDTQTVSYTDIFFIAEPSLRKITIPKEIIWYRYGKYCVSELGCYELIRPNYYSVNNLFYKIPSSNTINISEFTKFDVKDLKKFKTPLGSPFNPKQWKIGPLGLPVRN